MERSWCNHTKENVPPAALAWTVPPAALCLRPVCLPPSRLSLDIITPSRKPSLMPSALNYMPLLVSWPPMLPFVITYSTGLPFLSVFLSASQTCDLLESRHLAFAGKGSLLLNIYMPSRVVDLRHNLSPLEGG